MQNANAYEIFTPNGLPTFTYVKRALHDKAGNSYSPEDKLEKQLRIPGRVVSIAGPSKSGKTALVETVVGIDNVIKISGAQITNEEKLWGLILEQLAEPNETKSTIKSTGKSSEKFEGKAEAGFPVGLKFTAGASTENATENSIEESETIQSKYNKAVAALKKQKKILFLDDFHYMAEDVQKNISEVIKHVAEYDKLSICVAQVRHKSDLVIRKNPDLTGRLTNIDFDLWDNNDIKKIGTGFNLLNINISDALLEAFAQEAGGSPQIMQSICLSACAESGMLEKQEQLQELHAKNIDIDRVISTCIESIDRDRLAGRLEDGPPTHGTERLSFKLIDGTQHDVYGCILAAIALNPPWLEIKKSQLLDRIGFIVNGTPPNTTSILNSIGHMQSIANKYDSFNDYIEWDADRGLQILDPYLLFYIRWTKKFRSVRDSYEAYLRKKH